MMPTPQQRRKLRDAFISAFPNKSLIEQMLYFQLGRNLNEITRDSDLQEIAFKLIQTAEAQGWLVDLVQAARKENPGNSDLAAIAQELLPPETSNSYKQKILILADAFLNKNTQKIELALERAVKPDSFEIKVRTVVSPQDIRRAVGEERPSIVHFCCHGTEDGNLVLKDNEGNDKPVLRAVLADLFKLYANYVKCVLLNACYSFQSAKAISQHINYVISLEQSIQENAAIVFAEGFYNGLGYDDLNNSYAIQRAFDEGMLALKLDCSRGIIVPDLWNQGILQVGNLSSDRNVDEIPPKIVQSQQIDDNCSDRNTDDLSSDRNVDYTQLRDFLKAGQWKKADEETLAVMLKVTLREKEGWLDAEDIENFPCTDLRTIDQLWVKYSDGRFGFSVQKQIYLDVGGVPDGKYYREAWDKFGDRVGWRVKESWINYRDVTLDTNSPRGHLPVAWTSPGAVLNGIGEDMAGMRPIEKVLSGIRLNNQYKPSLRPSVSSLAWRLVNCNL